MSSNKQIDIVHRGHEEYQTSFDAMRSFTQARDEHTQDQLWIVEHPPVFTLGLGADRSHVLAAHDIPTIQTDRGGEVTFHGPGQVVIYLLIDLRRRHKKGRLYAKEFVYQIEQAVIDTLDGYNVAGERIVGAPGIYLKEGIHRGAKIAALGLKVKANGCTYHGVSLNVSMDLQPFSWINPCGYVGLATIDLASLGMAVPLAEVQNALAQRLQFLLTDA
ncbi:MAG: lipoyl(octanoyl) transferase LipB [Undibacterium sp.]|nr:lipoyl(octanoyl) transferase LipB [Undibacterium sp.]